MYITKHSKRLNEWDYNGKNTLISVSKAGRSIHCLQCHFRIIWSLETLFCELNNVVIGLVSEESKKWFNVRTF